MAATLESRVRIEGQVVRHPDTGRYHVRLLRLADGQEWVSDQSFATVAAAERELRTWIRENGARLLQ